MRLVDADALLKHAYDSGLWKDAEKGFHQRVVNIEDIEDAPTVDAVEVVRCKDCKYCEHWYADKGLCCLWYDDGVDVFGDGYCNYGKRKENEID